MPGSYRVSYQEEDSEESPSTLKTHPTVFPRHHDPVGASSPPWLAPLAVAGAVPFVHHCLRARTADGALPKLGTRLQVLRKLRGADSGPTARPQPPSCADTATQHQDVSLLRRRCWRCRLAVRCCVVRHAGKAVGPRRQTDCGAHFSERKRDALSREPPRRLCYVMVPDLALRPHGRDLCRGRSAAWPGPGFLRGEWFFFFLLFWC
jgi:hypothetical protein